MPGLGLIFYSYIEGCLWRTIWLDEDINDKAYDWCLQENCSIFKFVIKFQYNF